MEHSFVTFKKSAEPHWKLQKIFLDIWDPNFVYSRHGTTASNRNDFSYNALLIIGCLY